MDKANLMSVIKIKKGLNIPIAGVPRQVMPVDSNKPQTRRIALLGNDYPDLKPTMMVKEGEQVKLGQKLFTDKKNPGVFFTSPGCGIVTAIKRGAKRKFEAIIIELAGDDCVEFSIPAHSKTSDQKPAEQLRSCTSKIRDLLIESGLWTAIRSRPYGKIPAINSEAHSLLITAMDTRPLAANPELIIAAFNDDFMLGTKILNKLVPNTTVCLAAHQKNPFNKQEKINTQQFSGPHPAGLPSTHIHFLDPVHSGKEVWHINYQDVIAIGHLFRTGFLAVKRIISLAGPAIKSPRLIATRLGASISEICHNELKSPPTRVISGSVLCGYHRQGSDAFLGRYHNQVSALNDDARRGFLNWLWPGWNRFSVKRLFAASFLPNKKFAMSTAAWGGQRAIFPLGTYEKVMPLDIMATDLLKALANKDTEKSQELGCLELIEEDLALCSFVCPGKNNFSAMLRQILQQIEKNG